MTRTIDGLTSILNDAETTYERGNAEIDSRKGGGMEVISRPTGVLQGHPLNASIYDAERDDSDLRRSIAERGIISPLVIDQHNTILAGHRRCRAACALTLDSVPVIVRDIGDPLEAERILIESNRQREKTPSEVMHEADNLARIFAEEARRRMLAGQTTGDKTAGRGRPKTDDSSVPTLAQSYDKTRTKVAEAVGMKRSTYAKVKHVYDTAHDTAAPEPIRAVAQQQITPRHMIRYTCLHLAWQECWPINPVIAPNYLPNPGDFLPREGSIYVRHHVARSAADGRA